MRFRVLGPVELVRDDTVVDLGPPSVRFILAVLLLEANHVVPLERLIELTWPDEPPRTARRTVQVRVSRLRAALCDAAPLETEGSGYVLRVDPDAVDAHRFQRLVRQADDETPAAAVHMLREALDLWRGPALAGVASKEVRDRLTLGLEELRLSTIERLAGLQLRLGRYPEVVDELHRMVAERPGRENAVVLLARALHDSGQTGRGLELLRRHRERLADELGLDPGPRLQRLELALLRGEPAEPTPPAARPASTPPPAQLPTTPGRFRGRDAELRALDEALDDAGDAATIMVVTGMPGVGKTALTLHWARRVADRFPDGQLFVDLRGHATEPALAPRDALAGFLRALGADPASVPAGVAEAAADYRSRVAGARLLVVLDNAASAEQVRPLLPGAPGCLTLITSRYRLDGLLAHEGARRTTLRPLPDAEARDVLTATLDPRQVDDAALGELVALCGGLPLALRIAAANIELDGVTDLADHVREMRTDGGLGYLAVDDTAVRTAFDISYLRLDPRARRAFRCIGLAPGYDVTPAATAALLDTTEQDATSLLRSLDRTHLVDLHRPGRYRLHDLLRTYAAERVTDDDEDQRAAACDRLTYWYTHATAAAVRIVFPDRAIPPLPGPAAGTPAFHTPEEAIDWLDAEADNLVATVLAAAPGTADTARLLAGAMRPYFVLSHDLATWRRVAEAVQGVRSEAGDTLPRAITALVLGELAMAELRHAEAQTLLTEAERLCADADWPAGRLDAVSLRAVDCARSGRTEEAEQLHRRLLGLARETDDSGAAGRALAHLGTVALGQGRLGRARELLARAAELLAGSGAVATRANALSDLGITCQQLGMDEQALETLLEAREAARSSGRRSVMITVLNSLGVLHVNAGRYAEALRAVEEALPLATELRRPRWECAALLTMATACRGVDRLDEAREHAERALALARDRGLPHRKTQACTELAEIAAAAGNVAAARRHVEAALADARAHGYRTEEARALLALSSTERAAGDIAAATDAATRALAGFRAVGSRQGIRRAERQLDVVSEGESTIDGRQLTEQAGSTGVLSRRRTRPGR